ncbi:MAG: META domain-containing protein [Deltaproteobacteria bacterium]|nr:META domain-containing protein [Deltaproteobacteria bacterium]
MTARRTLGALLLVATSLALGCRPAMRAPAPGRAAAPVELAALEGTSWILAAWGDGAPAASTPRVSLRYAAGRFEGRSGCNRYTAPVEQRSGGGAIAVGAIAVTRMMCAEPAAGIEQRFLAALGRARASERQDGRLGIATVGADGRPETLVFTAEPTAP